MNCVNKNSKEFKFLARKFDLDANTLELIVHQYQAEVHSEEDFPSDLFIQEYLGNTQYVEKGKSIRALWKKEYASPKEFLTLEQLETAKTEALKFFPSEAIVCYKNHKGNFILNVKEPVTTIQNVPLKSSV